MNEKFKQQLISDMRSRAVSMLELLDKIEADHNICKLDAKLRCNDIRTTSKHLEKMYFA